MVMLRSNFAPGTTQWAVRRAQWRAMGLTDADLEKPKVAIVNSSSELSTCFSHLDELVEEVKAGVRVAGGLPFEIHTVAPSDFITSAGRQGRYLMPARELIVNDIEVAVEGAQLDGMVCLASCDKTAPGQLMAAARLNVPTVIVACGYQGHGQVCGAPTDIEDVFESVGTHARGDLSLPELRAMTDVAVCGSGVCAGMGTANTMHLASEALGMSLPGSTPVAASSTKLRTHATRAGRRIVEMIWEDLRPRDIMSAAAFRNAVRACLAVSGSVNAVRHLQAVSVEAGSPVDVYELFDDLGPKTPLLVAVRPNGPTRIEQLESAGGTQAVLKRLEASLDGEAVTVAGNTVAEQMRDVNEPGPEVIRPVDAPVSAGPSLVLVSGSLAPEGGIIKLGAAARDLRFTGRAKVFDSQDAALAALADGTIRQGDVVVLYGLGPRGGPGVASASWFVAALNGAGLAGEVAVVTDGQLSGLNRGIVVGQISPEAAAGGPLALVHDGDPIAIDVEARSIELCVGTAVLQQRAHGHLCAADGPESGWLAVYREVVQPLSKGAVLGRHFFRENGSTDEPEV